MTVHDLGRPDGKFATELGWGGSVGSGHGNENGNVAVCGIRVGLRSIIGFPGPQLGVGLHTEGSPPRASATRGRKRRDRVKRGCTG